MPTYEARDARLDECVVVVGVGRRSECYCAGGDERSNRHSPATRHPHTGMLALSPALSCPVGGITDSCHPSPGRCAGCNRAKGAF
jgi:hypothetical protein